MNYDDLDNNHAIVNYLISTTKHVIWKHRNEVKYNNAARNSKDIILSLKRSIFARYNFEKRNDYESDKSYIHELEYVCKVIPRIENKTYALETA